MDGAKKKDVDKKIAEKTFDLMVQFGGYGFNKSHATAYGLVAYQTAYLKANYPVEYMAALMTSEIGHSNLGSKEVESKLVGYMNEAQDMGVRILIPDVQMSGMVFSVESAPGEKENPSIRFGLSAVKNVGESAVDSILKTRREQGPFKNLADFCARVDTRLVNRKVVESLLKAGAFDCFRPVLGAESDEVRMMALCRFRSELFAQVENVLSRAARQKEDAATGQSALFDLGTVAGAKAPVAEAGAAAAEEWPEHMLLANEKEVLGFYLSGHPLARYRKELKSYVSHSLGQLPASGIVRAAGMIVNTKKTVTKTGKAMARFKLEDLEGEIECIVFPKTYTPEIAGFLVAHEMVVVKGKLEARNDEKELFVEELVPLREARERLVRWVVLSVSTAGFSDEPLNKLHKICSDHPGNSGLVFRLKTPTHGDYALMTGRKVKPTDGFLHEVERVLGRGSWELKSA
jgi:DNA polymerase-3 subunit alpha